MRAGAARLLARMLLTESLDCTYCGLALILRVCQFACAQAGHVVVLLLCWLLCRLACLLLCVLAVLLAFVAVADVLLLLMYCWGVQQRKLPSLAADTPRAAATGHRTRKGVAWALMAVLLLLDVCCSTVPLGD